MSNILKLASFLHAGFNWFGWMESFQCLDAGHLVRTDDVDSLCMQGNSLRIGATNRVYHPRIDAISRMYRYRLFYEPTRDPIRERFAWRMPAGLNEKFLVKTARAFLGKHDFSSFGSPSTPKGTTLRTVMKAEWIQTTPDEWQFEVEADAFLYRMVRRLVFVQVAAAQGKLDVEELVRCLAKQPPAGKRSVLPAGLAPAHGLTLVAVRYQESIE